MSNEACKGNAHFGPTAASFYQNTLNLILNGVTNIIGVTYINIMNIINQIHITIFNSIYRLFIYKQETC